MSACHVHPTGAEPGCVDCLQDQRDCYRAEVNQLRATLEIAGLEPVEGDRCRLCSWESNDGVVFRVRRQCWPCHRIQELEAMVYMVGELFDAPEILNGRLVVPSILAASVLAEWQKKNRS